jgi:phage terminase large subunit-like protein
VKLNFETQAGGGTASGTGYAATYLQIRETIGAYDFLSQYRQRPGTKVGGVVKDEWIKYYEPSVLPTHMHYTFQSWDTAGKCGELNDYSVCTTLGIRFDKFYLLDVFRGRLSYPE